MRTPRESAGAICMFGRVRMRSIQARKLSWWGGLNIDVTGRRRA